MKKEVNNSYLGGLNTGNSIVTSGFVNIPTNQDKLTLLQIAKDLSNGDEVKFFKIYKKLKKEF